MSQKDIDEVLTAIASPLPSPNLSLPILGGYAQPMKTPVICSCCGKSDHISMECPRSPISPNEPVSPQGKCFCYGQIGHAAVNCPSIESSPTYVATPSVTAFHRPHHQHCHQER